MNLHTRCASAPAHTTTATSVAGPWTLALFAAGSPALRRRA